MKIIEIGPGGVALGDEHDHWLLLSAAPEIAQHALLDDAARDGRLAGVVLLDAQLEHAARLAALSRAHPLALYATPGVGLGRAAGGVARRDRRTGACARARLRAAARRDDTVTIS